MGNTFLPYVLLAVCSLMYINNAVADTVYAYNKAVDSRTQTASRTVIGSKRYHIVKDGETLLDLARQYDLGYNEIVLANPNLDPWVPDVGALVVIPQERIIPDAPDNGIVINVPEMRLYYFFSANGKKKVKTYPLGLGREGASTPVGVFRISSIEKNPTWDIPASIRRERPELPAAIPPGPENPLGTHWLRLSNTSYGIHGTHMPLGVGRRVSHGCIRLYPEDIVKLASSVKIGTPVRILKQTVKFGFNEGSIYVEVEEPLKKASEKKSMLKYAVDNLRKQNLLGRIDMNALQKAINDPRGFPVKISKN